MVVNRPTCRHLRTNDNLALSFIIVFIKEIASVGFPGSVDSPENQGFWADSQPGLVDFSALIEWTAVIPSCRHKVPPLSSQRRR
ncbi:protein of unknown function (plasmid) [Shinella sp. WSC3-e]|nr:hypothetical protein SHINE37_100165 [Rhizobiaceae bacterium]CAK7261710.1 protein of unknown function [Shinella sp. WSC3-e]